MDRAWPRPSIDTFGGGRVAADEMWALYKPLCPAHEAAHVFEWAGPGRAPRYVVYCCCYFWQIHDKNLDNVTLNGNEKTKALT